MSTSLAYASCQACAGCGVLAQKDGLITCSTCHGQGGWLESAERVRFAYPIPELLSPSEHDQAAQRQLLLRVLAVGSAVACLASAAYLWLVGQADLWERGPLHLLFGGSGLVAAYSLARLDQRPPVSGSLHDLPASGQDGQPVSLLPYASPRLAQLLRQAASLAASYRQSQVDDIIFLIALLRHPRLQIMLARLELIADPFLEALGRQLTAPPSGQVRSVTLRPEVRQRIYAGFQEAIACRFPYLDLEDLLLAYLHAPGPFAQLFEQQGLDYARFHAVSLWYARQEEYEQRWSFWLEKGRSRPQGYMNRAWTALPTRFLDAYSQDLTRLAANGQAQMVTIRDKEIDQILQTLGRTERNSVLLVGEPGVGKDAALQGLAVRMVEEDVPEGLQDKRLVAMDLAALLSGGVAAEQNLQRVLDEVEQSGNVILAIPDVHALVGTSGGALDAASLLANAMARGYVQVISTATYADYHRYVESNPTFSSLLEIVEIKEPSQEQAVEVLEEEAPTIEYRQHVRLTYPAIEAAATLARRYFPDKALPGSAVRLIDESAAAAQAAKRSWVTRQDIERTVEQKTQIPVQQADQQEADLLLHLEERLHERIIGQREAVAAVADALRRARAGLHDGTRPLSSLLFVGPTGVGKTETAKAICELYFGQAQNMVRLDMSEYQDNRAVYRLIGAPAADSDSHTEGGALTQPIREHPFSLILLDELEKAYPDVLNLFLQLLDDGRLTENTGRTVYYQNTIVIATSNAGSSEVLALLQQGVQGEELRKQMLRILQGQFRPEFLNRFDAIVPFHPLGQEEIVQVVRLMLHSVEEKAAAQKLAISFAPETVSLIAQRGFDPLYGARPLRRFIQDKVEGMLARRILEKSLVPGQPLRIVPEMIE